jgi:hypothetical protein
LKTVPIGKLWTGIRHYNATREQFNAGVQDYIGNMINYPKAATLTSFGNPVASLGSFGSFLSGSASSVSSVGARFGGAAPSPNALGALFGSAPKNVGSRSRAADTTQVSHISDLMRALQGFKHLDLDPVMKAALQEQGAGAATPTEYGSYFLPMIYDGPKPPEAAWGKKLNALPLQSELWTMLEYKDIVRQFAYLCGKYGDAK